MDEASDLDFFRSLQQNVRTADICLCEAIRIAEAEIDVRLGCKMEDGIDSVSRETVQNLLWVGDVSANEGEILPSIQASYVVEGSTVIQFIKAEYVIGCFVCNCEMPYKP